MDIVKRIKNIDFELTYLCNLNCKHCYNPTHKASYELSTDKIKSVTKEIKELGFKEVHYNGGEPLIRKDIYEILEYSSRLGLKTLLETNAMYLTKFERIRQLNNFGIRASIDGSEKVHNYLKEAKTEINPYRTSLENLANLIKLGINVQITCSINALNYNSIYTMVNEISNYCLDNIRLRLTMPVGFAISNWLELEMSKENVLELRKNIKYIKENFSSIKFDDSSLNRGIPKYEPKFFITPDGFVKPYPFIDFFVGNVNEEMVSKILEKIAIVKLPEPEEKRIINYLVKIGMVNENEQVGI